MFDLPADFTALHGIAIVMLVVLFFAYAPIMSFLGRGTLNNQLDAVRRRWINLLITRPNRTYDAVLLGHVINAVAFFGSATLLVIAGLLGLMANLSPIYGLVSQLPFFAESSIALLALNLFVITAFLTTAFFSFTYALRKLVYTIALVAAFAEPDDTEEGEDAERVAAAASVLTEAVKTFNMGIRCYYYAAAGLLLFVSPIACIVASLGVTGMFVWRQTYSTTAESIGRYVETLDG